jgi:CDP-glucose 4,6-dehydratase
MVDTFWRGKRVFLTGHTGFKGSWLSLWLQTLGATVAGYALDPPSNPNLFEAAKVASQMESSHGDICDLPAMRSVIASFKPEVVLHLAAQSLVRPSYQDPLLTYKTNVIGSANLLECVRECASVRSVVVVTSDKCYENRESSRPYRETDTLGGYDPYSSSKACTELVVAAYRNSFFPLERYSEHRVAIATARAGNVIGGGDWAQDRLVPDIIRGFSAGRSVPLRNPHATRPWQHVLEPLRGYLSLAERLFQDGAKFSGPWNFGPPYSDAKPVEWIIKRLAEQWGAEARWEVDAGPHPHEASMLQLDWSKAAKELGWRPVLNLAEALDTTLSWYREFFAGKDARKMCLEQINAYTAKSAQPSAR